MTLNSQEGVEGEGGGGWRRKADTDHDEQTHSAADTLM